MAIRIVGVDLPQNKRGEIALTYIYGIGRSSSAKILAKAGVDKDIKVKDNILADPKYNYLFTVDTLNEMVVAGMPFRDAYKAVAEQLENGTYESPKATQHTHEGSINNLCLKEIKEKMQNAF